MVIRDHGALAVIMIAEFEKRKVFCSVVYVGLGIAESFLVAFKPHPLRRAEFNLTHPDRVAVPVIAVYGLNIVAALNLAHCSQEVRR